MTDVGVIFIEKEVCLGGWYLFEPVLGDGRGLNDSIDPLFSLRYSCTLRPVDIKDTGDEGAVPKLLRLELCLVGLRYSYMLLKAGEAARPER